MDTGKVSESVLKRSVLKYVQLNNQTTNSACVLHKAAEAGADSALFSILDETKSQQINVKELARIGAATAAAVGRHRMIIVETMITACNNLICSGAEPFGVELSLMLPEALYESELRHMMEEAAQYASSHHIMILGGHTMVSREVTETAVTVTALGLADSYCLRPAKAGMEVVMSKWIGLQGTARLARTREEELKKRLPLRLIKEAGAYSQYQSVIPEARIAMSAQAAALHDVSGGGIFRALWELAESAGTGIRIALKKIPVKQETIEICEVFGLNPYELLSGGALLMVTDHGENLVRALKDEGINAEVIGELTEDNDKVIVTRTDDGTEIRYLDKPKTDEIDK